jgi:outer membrane protein
MKHLKTFLLTLTLTLGLLFSQAQVAHINSELLVQSMPETKTMQEALNKIGQEYQIEIETQKKEFTAKAKKYQEEGPTKSNDINEKRQIELSELQQKLQLYVRSAQEELQKKEYELFKPILEKAQTAIQDVATEKGIKYVMDSAPGKGLIVADGEDLMTSVKTKLGI